MNISMVFFLYVCTSSAGVKLNSLISLDELESRSKKYNVTNLSNINVLTNVQVLLITTSENDYLALQSYLHPLSGNTLSKYGYYKPTAGEHAFYVIGKYGECTSAIRMVHPESLNINVLSMASECFNNLGAVFIIGAITGVSDKINPLDVLISTNICTYELSTSDADIDVVKKAKLHVSGLFCELFNQPPKWPNIENKLVNDLKGIKPHLHLGSVLCGPVVNEKIGKLLMVYPQAIGVDNSCTKLFTAPGGFLSDNIMIVKCVSDKQCTEPTAALLAADCLEHYLKNPQLSQFLTPYKGT